MHPLHLFKHLLLNAILMLIVVIAVAMMHGGVVAVYGTGWIATLLLLSFLGGAVCGALLMTFIMPRDLDFSRRDIMTYSALFFVLIGSYMQGMTLLEWLFGRGGHQKIASTVLVTVLYILGRSIALQLMPSEKWQIKRKNDDLDSD